MRIGQEIKMKRKVHLDALRIIACFCVLVNHTNNLVFWWQATPYSETWYVSMFYFFATKIAVPLFLMISGAVLLGKEETIKVVLKKRVLRSVAVLVIASGLFTFALMAVDPETNYTVGWFFRGLIEKPICNSYWYLYTYICLMLLLPFLRKAIPYMTKIDYIYLVALFAIVCGTLPILNHYWSFPALTGKFTQSMLPVYIVYMYLGYFMEHMLEERYYTKRGALVAFVVYLVISGVCAYGLSCSYTYPAQYDFFLDNVSLITIMLQSICIYYIAKVVFQSKRLANPDCVVNRVVTGIGGCTFGIYLMGDYLIGKFQPMYNQLVTHMNRIPAVILHELAVFATGLVITAVLRKLPVFRKLL